MLTILLTPFGRLAQKREEHDRLLQRIPLVRDSQAASTTSICALRPAATAAYAAVSHGSAVTRCLATLLGHADAPLPPQSERAAHACEKPQRTAMPLTRPSLPVIQARSPSAANRLLIFLRAQEAGPLPSILAAAQAAAYLAGQGYAVPAWDDAHYAPPDPFPGQDERAEKRGAARVCDERFETHSADLSPAARVFTVLPTSDIVAVSDPHFRVLLLRRLRLPLPLGPRACSCRSFLGEYGDHRAAFSNSGVLASRALPLERAVARVCLEAGVSGATPPCRP